MRVYIDGMEFPQVPGASAAAVLDEVRRETSRNGRVVMEIRLDNVVMDEEAFSNVSGGLCARFDTRPVRDLVRESLEEALRYLPKLTQGLQEIALHFEGNELAIGQGKLVDAANGLDWLLFVFQRCRTLMAAERDPGTEGLALALTESISALGALQEERQYLQMARNIRGSLIPEIEELRMYIQKLQELGASVQ